MFHIVLISEVHASASIEEDDVLPDVPDVSDADEEEEDDLKSYVDLESGGE